MNHYLERMPNDMTTETYDQEVGGGTGEQLDEQYGEQLDSLYRRRLVENGLWTEAERRRSMCGEEDI